MKIEQQLEQEYNNLKGQLILGQNHKIVMFIGIVDSVDDYYYLVTDLHGNILFETCVGRITELKNKIDDDFYNDAVRTFKLNNHYLMVKKEVAVESIKNKLTGHDKILFGIEIELK